MAEELEIPVADNETEQTNDPLGILSPKKQSDNSDPLGILKKKVGGNVSSNGTSNTAPSTSPSISDNQGRIFADNSFFKQIGQQTTPELQQRHDEILSRQKELNTQSKKPSILKKFDSMAEPILRFNRDLVQSINPKKVAEIDHDVNGHWGNIVQNVFAKIEKTGNDIAAGTLGLINDAEQLQNPIKSDATPLGYLIAGLNGNKKRLENVINNNQLPNTFLGNTVSSIASIAPDIAGAALAPEAKIAQGTGILAKAGGLLFNKFTNYLIGKGIATGYGEAKAEGKTQGEAAIQALKGGAEGAKQGIELAILGAGSGLATKGIMAQAEKAGLTGAKGLATRQLVNLSTDLVAYGLVQPTINAAEEGRFPTMKEIAEGAGIAAAFRIKGGVEELRNHATLNKAIQETQNQRQGVAISNFVDADHEAIKQVYEQPETAQELNIKALEAAKKAKETTDLEKKQQYVAEAITYTKASNVKSVTDAVLNNPKGVEEIQNSDLPDQVKQQFVQKAQEITDLLKPKQEDLQSTTVIKPEENIPTQTTTIAPKEYTPETKKSGVKVILPKQGEEQQQTTELPKTEESINQNETTQTEIQQPTEVKQPIDEKISENIGQPKEGEEGQGKEPPIEQPTESNKDNSGDNKVGVSHESLKSLAKKIGLSEPERGTRLTPEQFAERGRQLYNAGADTAQLEKDFKDGKQPTSDDISVARAHLENLARTADAMGKKWGYDSKQYKEAKDELARWNKEVVKPMGTSASEPFTALQGERDLDTDSFTTVQHKVEQLTGKETTENQNKKIKQLTETNEKLKKETEDTEKKLIEETDKTIGKEEPKKGYAEKAKKVADQFRKLKTKPFSFKDENGNDIPIKIQGVSWNDLVEVGAKAIEKTGEIADGIDAVLDKIKDSEWYVKLSNKDKERLSTELYNHYQKQIQDTPEAKTIKRLEKQLEDLRKGIVKQNGVKAEDTPKIKELKDQIFEEKKKLGLIKSKPVESNPTKLRITDTERKIEKLENEKADLEKGIVRQKEVKNEKPSPDQQEKIDKLNEDIHDLKQKLGVLKSKGEKPLTESEQAEADKEQLESLQEKYVDKKDSKFTPEESKEIWDYAKKNYLEKGVSYRDMISFVSEDLGLSWLQVSDAITSPKVKPISDAMWKKQSEYRRNQIATKNWVEEQKGKSKLGSALKAVPNLVRSISVFGHGGIFIGTHAGMNLFHPQTWNKTIPAFIRAWKYAYGNTGQYEREMVALKDSPNYVLAERAGLKNNPDRINAEEYQKSQKYLGKLGLAGEKGFNAIKVLRQDLFDYHYDKLSPSEKADPEAIKSIAKLVNLATGATNLKISPKINEITFAGGMEAARWGKLLKSPAEATATAIKALVDPKSASVGDRVFAKIWAKRVGTQLGTYISLLGVNAVIQSLIDPKNPVNILHPSESDWLKFKFGSITVDPTSGMLSTANFIRSLASIASKDQKELRGDTRYEALGKRSFGYVRGKLAPFYSTAADFASQSDFYGNPLPFSKDKPRTGKHKLTWTEYAWQKAPLPVAEAATVMYKSALDNGNDKMKVHDIIDGIIAGGLSGATGFRVGETKEKYSPFTEEDKKVPAFKYFNDRGLEMPHTTLSSEIITNKLQGVKKKISDYPKEVQQAYEEEHKSQLKKELSDIIRKDKVYVETYVDADGNEGKQISTTPGRHKKAESLKNLSKDELTQVLRIAQSEATKNTKIKIFGKHMNKH